MELAVAVAGGSIVILNGRMQTLGQYEVPGRAIGQEVFTPVRRGRGVPCAFIYGTSKSWELEGSPAILEELYGMVQLRLNQPFPWSLLSYLLIGLSFLLVVVVLYSQASYRELIRYTTKGMVEHSGVVILNRSGRVRSANKHAKELLRMDAASKGAKWDTVVAGPEFGVLQEATIPVLAGRERQASREVSLPTPAGNKAYMATISRMRSRGYLVSLEDLSAVEYAQRVATWGPVAQRLAHTMKSPLTAIELNLKQVEERCDASAKPLLAAATRDAQRVRTMADSFTRLANFGSPQLELRDVNALVKRVVDSMGLEFRGGLRLTLQLGENLPCILLDEGQLVVAIRNIVDNALSAIENRGALSISTGIAGDGWVEVVVGDSGPGIPDADMTRVLEPFYTTKPGGTGLGLAIVKKAVEDHGGTVAIVSEPEHGTKVKIRLPAARGGA